MIDNLLAFYRTNLGISEEQEQQIIKEMKELDESNPTSLLNANKNIVLLDENTNAIGTVEALQMEMIDQLGTMVGDLMMKVTELEGKVNA
ncbi:hypothetical protein [Schinkia azotoformans]|uniref:hypothetical protein n=1 Tax=Schinkia azotoformans TaxID=1454 RepID=UPI002DBE3E14|nr:hypothetical protein [Schinkia azotoformans]MEC1757364.1 hypothetical protein [Schinkia azotoformans]